MFSKFFIHRPIFAIVISLVILIAGSVSILTLPVAQYPQITPPTVEVETVYVGANARTVEESVAVPIEQEVNGAENMIYLSSKSSSDGRYVLTCTFALGTNIDIAAVDVQNRVKKAEGTLPAEVKNYGISVKKKSPDMLMAIAVHAPDGAYDDLFLSNYASINLIDPMLRVRGVGSTQLVGQRDYSMRLWVRPDRLAKLGVTAGDLAGVIREQNVQAPAGQVGQPPAKAGVAFQYSVDVKGRLTTPEEYDDVVVRTHPDGSVLRMRDVARTELGAKDYKSLARFQGRPAVLILVYQLPGANALEVAEGIRGTLGELSKQFPPGLECTVSLDNTKFVEASIEGVVHTLVEAIVLVLVVVFVFLGNVRATVIPMLAVPVSLVGTFAAFVLLGFSINTLTLFALVLAIGIVVDDAIVVVEAVEHEIAHGLDPVAATEKAMSEISGPVVAMTLVLCAVFVPVSFTGGISGQLFRQFAIAVCVSVLISAVVALTLTPALCRLMLRARTPMRGPVGAFLRAFDRVFDRVTRGYLGAVRAAVAGWPVTLAALGTAYFATFGLMKSVPTSFVPEEDQGYMFVAATLPDGASLERTDALLQRCEEVLAKDPAVDQVMTLGGLNVITGAYTSNNGSFIVVLKDWKDRGGADGHVQAVIARARRSFAAYPEAIVLAFSPTPIPGLGTAGGFQFELQDRAGSTPEALAVAAQEFTAAASQRPELVGLFNAFSANVPQLDLRLDRDKCKTLGVPIDAVLQSLQTYLGGLQVNDTTILGRTYKVMIQAEPEFRTDADNIRNVYVRAAGGSMVPLGTLVTIGDRSGPDVIQRFNLFRTAEISGAAAPGRSSGEAIAAMEDVARTALPQGFGYSWTGTAYQEKESSGGQALVLGMALVFVFLFLAAQYESWAIPFGVLLGIPLAILGAFTAVFVRDFVNDVYVQIGVTVLFGLAAKNAILIVEVAKAKRDAGGGIVESALEAAKLRFRPILMTAFAFILGVVPLVRASGAGAASRQSMGTAVFGGMLVATVAGVVVVPFLYVVIERLLAMVTGKSAGPTQPAGGAPAAGTAGGAG